MKNVAKILDCSEKCIWNWIQKGEIGVTRFGGLVRISYNEIEKKAGHTPPLEELLGDFI
ncbi:MAG: helix-turn-helix domain-containing protein [Fidelibacterota bacterium]|nr:MAG: helix-turn-helix domain-containing protein [Candidatus Neomarinimicrobiota bacterium]